MSAAPHRPDDPTISHLGLSVTDLDRSVAFYCDVLGAKLVRAPYEADRGAFRLALVHLASTGLDLCEHDANHGESFEPARTGLDHLAFNAASKAELEQWASWLDSRGVARSEIRDGGQVGLMFDFVDPDGVQLEFFFVDQERLRTSTTYGVSS
jgi:glyoxylase I family protein